jgi:ribosomal protein S18 acetylase RimI-like enzyme|tara:strand:+ start:332 stop:802 length:471 start_codon:yes stop_codon:yes gene_type:complete
MDKLSTRKGAISDIEIIVQFQKNMALETEEKILLESSIRSGVTEVIGDEQKGTYLVAEHEDKIIGSLLITYEWSDWRNGWFWWIQSVYVKKEWRRKGVYSHLYDEVKKLSLNEGNVCGIRLYVEKENKIAQTVYKNLGMYDTKYLLYETEFSEDAT